MSLAAPKPRPVAHPRRAAAFALAALAFVLAFLGATPERDASAHVAAIGSLQVRASTATLLRAAESRPDPERRAPAVRLVTEGPDETADLGDRAPTPTSAVRSRGERGWDGELPELFGVAPAARCLAPTETATLLDGATGARIAALHERTDRLTPDHEPNPARGPPLS